MNSNNSSGISFIAVLAAVFVIFKLTDVIDWSWVWVLSPLWIPFAVVTVVLVFLLIISTIVEGNEK